MPLRTLVNRRGLIAATDTHIDVIFDLGKTDIRIRRAAIDINPGWLPWLGKVVQFHYQPGNQDNA